MTPNAILSLGYVGVRAPATSDWDDYAEHQLGLELVDRGAQVRAFRMDDRSQRLMVGEGPPGLDFIGWEVAGADALDGLAARLDAVDCPVTAGGRALADRRHVADVVWFTDPDGNRVELFHGPHRAKTAFRPARPNGGFVTGMLGLGHAVLSTGDIARLRAFYVDVLGFRVSDFGQLPVPVCFLHTNPRHHSLAMIESGQRGVHHLMLEYAAFDDLGRGYDIALADGNRISQTLGRHTNDWMTSFYTHSPSGFFIESGFGGRLIDPETWAAHETDGGPSLWGHERLYLDPAKRAEFRTMRDRLAETGVRAPNCPWLAATRTQI